MLEVLREEIADHAQGQLGLLVDQGGRFRLLRLRFDRLPELLQEDEVALDVLRARALGRRADDHAAFLHIELLHDVLEALALVVVEPARDAEPLAVRNEDDETAGQRHLHRQPSALRLHRILHGLNEHPLAAAQKVLDPLAVPLAFALRPDDLIDVEEAVLLEADLDERRLHPRQDVVDRAEVDVAGDRPSLRALEVDLGDAAVLEDGDTLLADVDGDEQLALCGRQRRPARSRAAALAALRTLFALLQPPFLRLRADGFGLLLRFGFRPCRGRLLTTPPTACATAALGLRQGVGCRRLGGGGCFRRCFGLLRGGSLCRRLRPIGFAPTEQSKRQTKSPCRARAAARSGAALHWVCD